MLNADILGPVNIVARNNISGHSECDHSNDLNTLTTSASDFDYDLVGAGHTIWSAEEAHAFLSNPEYDPNSSSGKFALKAGSPGEDAGVVIPNFNDEFVGAAPDVGAQERGRAALRFGTR